MVATSNRSESCADESALLLMSMCLGDMSVGRAMDLSIPAVTTVQRARLGDAHWAGGSGHHIRNSPRLGPLVDEPVARQAVTEPTKESQHGVR